MAWGDGEQLARIGKRDRGEEAASENPHHNAKLLERLLDGGERRSDGAAEAWRRWWRKSSGA
jgi:hypothetical protein